MLTAISRYGVRVPPHVEQIVRQCRRRGEMIQGPHIREFENVFSRRMGGGYAISASYGRMAFYYILLGLRLPPGSEIILPALTFWVIPEIARVAGYRPVFVDIDPRTFTLDPKAFANAITPNTRAVVPTHLYGLPCEMDSIMEIAARHDIRVIEDCAHALGATYRGRAAGTFGDASFFSFQTLKPLNASGGGMAFTKDAALASRIVSLVAGEPWPELKRVERRLLTSRLMRVFTRPGVFTFTGFPILLVAAMLKAKPDVYLWEKIRSLDPLPPDYRERFSNVQAAIGLAGLDYLDEWNTASQSHAAAWTRALEGIEGVLPPLVPENRVSVFYQYCVYAPDRDRIVERCIRRAVDVETLHVDVCSTLPLFGTGSKAPAAEKAAEVVQLPAYATLTEPQMKTITARVRSTLLATTAGTAAGKRMAQV